MPKFLLDANLSPLTAHYLRENTIQAKSILEENLGQLTDEEIVARAKRGKRIVITFDRDFAELWYFKEWGKIGIILLKTRHQRPAYINPILGTFLSSKVIEKQKLTKSLIVLSESGYRVVNP